MARPVRITQYHVDTRGAAPAMKIAVIADLHASTPFWGAGRVAALVDQVNALGADLILLLGDYVGHSWGTTPVTPDVVAAELLRLQAPLGVNGVFGNHDWRDDPGAQAARRPTIWHDTFAQAGLRMLNNDVVHLPTTPRVQLAGLDSQEAFRRRDATDMPENQVGAHDLDLVLSQLDPDTFSILMAHEPDVFPDLPSHINLTISGHTHGGQIAPFGQRWFVPSKYGTRYSYGHVHETGKDLIISGGLGTSILPIRIGVPPEVVEVTLI
ncbi:MAG: metallophosphoesterase [Paracoccaceae bacterium]